ncbi:MAG: hypothetical protein ABSC18_10245, partial [Verrucomicrobiota bacterium]
GGRIFVPGRGGDAAGAAAPASLNMLLPRMRRFSNDNAISMEFLTANSGYPMLVQAPYGKGTLCVLALPDDFADIYRLPQSVLTQIRSLLGRDLFVSLDAPDHVSLFVYDNRAFIVQNFQSQAVSTRVTARATALRDLLSNKTVAASAGGGGGEARGGRGGGGLTPDFAEAEAYFQEVTRGGRGGGGRGGVAGNGRSSFEVPVAAHSFRVFAAE